MSEVKFGLANSEEIRKKFYDIYHNPIFEKKPFDYNKLKGDAKIDEDAIRTAFFAGFHCAEEVYQLRETMELLNKSGITQESKGENK